MKLRCKKEALRIDGSKAMAFTRGCYYDFDVSFDPPGWSTLDDNGREVIFFDVSKMFEPI